MLMSTGWTLEKTHIPVNYFPTNGWIDQFTQSSGHEPIDYQLAGQDTKTTLVVCYYLDAAPKLFPVPHFWWSYQE